MLRRVFAAILRAVPIAARSWRLIAALLLLVFAFIGPPGVGAARDHNARVLESAVVAYAALRAINASLSVAKETSVGIELFGSVEGKPAMVLDPVDETVARISGAIFAVAAVSSIIAIAIAPSAQVGAAIAGIGLLALALARRFDGMAGWPALGAIRTVTSLGLFFALVLPLGYAAGGWIGERATEVRLQAALEQLQGEEAQISSSVAALSDEAGEPAEEAIPLARNAPARGDEGSVMDRVFGNVNQAAGSVADMGREAFEGLRRQAQDARDSVPDMAQVQARGTAIVESGIALLAVYTVRLVVFPVLTLLFLWVFLRRATRAD